MSKSDQLIRALRATHLKKRPPLMIREKIPSKTRNSNSNKLDPSHKISVMTFNTLAQGLSNTKQGAFECTEGLTNWTERRAMILEEILTYPADIIGLQEVDAFSYFKSHLESIGYSGHFLEKPDSPCFGQPDYIGPDGSALFYNTNRFQFITKISRNLLLRDGAETNASVLGFVLEEKTTGAKIAVFTTHLKAKKEFFETRVEQAEYLKKTLVYAAVRHRVDHIFCFGDFNATPDEPAIEHMLEPDTQTGLVLSNSYYDALGGVHPEYTTWKKRRNIALKKASIDYIWYSSKLHVEQILQVPQEDQIGPSLFPALNYPSDHVSLWAEFSY